MQSPTKGRAAPTAAGLQIGGTIIMPARALPSKATPRRKAAASPRPCRSVRGQSRAFSAPSGGSQVLGRRLSGLAVGNDLEGDFLAFLELVEAGALDRADVDEDVLAAVLRLDESVALLRVEPLHGSFGHGVLVFHMRVDLSRARCTARVVSRFWEGRQSGALVAARPSRSAETRWQRI